MIKPRDIELMYELGCLRHLDRQWSRFLGMKTANISEHIFRVLWLALLIAKEEKGVDQEKLLKIALVHDVAESRTGDVDYISRQYTKRDEEKGVHDMFAGTALEDEMIALTKEYEERQCLEAKIVKDADNIDVQMELEEQTAVGQTIMKLWRSHRDNNVKNTLFTKTAQKLWSLVYKINPHDWHINSSGNRFRGGDWKNKK